MEILSSQPECQTCRLCEEHVGLVYLLGKESARVRSHRLPVLRTMSGVEYLGRVPDREVRKEGLSPVSPSHGWCSAFDPTTNMCRIYSDRPLCCRIYPLDLMRIDSQVWWVMHTECPIAQRFEKERRLGIIAAITARMERFISSDNLEDWLSQDKFSQIAEAFSHDATQVIRVRRYGEPIPFP